LRNFAGTALFRLAGEREREREREREMRQNGYNKKREVKNQIKKASDIYKLPFKNVSVRPILSHGT